MGGFLTLPNKTWGNFLLRDPNYFKYDLGGFRHTVGEEGTNARVREAEMGKCSQLGQPEAMMQNRVTFWNNLPALFGH